MPTFNLKRVDWVLNGIVLALAIFSLITISSIAPHLFWQQLIWFILGFGLILLFSQIDWRPLINHRWIIFSIYFFFVGLLGITFLFAPTIRGIRGWLVIGPFQMQTSEFVKIALIIVFAYFFARRHVGIALWRNIFIPFVYLLIPAVFVLLQPDLGSALILFGLWIGFLLVSGIRMKHIAIGLLILSTVVVWSWFSFLQGYQKERIVGLFNPEYDPLGVNYNVIQAKIAIGSAGFLGKGYGQGTQVQLGFLPEAPTDFILAALIEEWGLLGGLILIGLFFMLLFRIIRIGSLAKNNFPKLLCLGTVILFILHFIVNVGSNIGLLPVIGVPFPFLSYGGSNLLTSAALIGIVQSIANRFSF